MLEKCQVLQSGIGRASPEVPIEGARLDNDNFHGIILPPINLLLSFFEELIPLKFEFSKFSSV